MILPFKRRCSSDSIFVPFKQIQAEVKQVLASLRAKEEMLMQRVSALENEGQDGPRLEIIALEHRVAQQMTQV